MSATVSTDASSGTASPPQLGTARIAFAAVERARLRLWDCRIGVISVLLGAFMLLLVPPVQDLLLEIRTPPSIIGFAVIVLVFWALPIHNTSARAVDHVHRPPTPGCERAQHVVDLWTPRVLGGLPLLIVLLAARATARSLDTADGVPEIDATLEVLGFMQLCMIGAVPVYAAYVLWRRRVLANDHHGFFPSLFRAMPTAIVLFSFLVLAYAVFDPSEFVWQVGREDLIPVALGGWVPAFAYLALLSHRSGWPITMLVFLVLLGVTVLADRFHDVRTFRSPAWVAAHQDEQPGPERQTYIGPAIDRWMAANGCAGAPHDCPPAVLIAAEGGGSRAAFYTGTILGALLDATRDYPRYYHDFGKAIFAMSGVSGGALGIALTRTALLDAHGGRLPPCLPGSRDLVDSSHPDPHIRWRACLQLLAAGDYLSPVMLGAIFRDTFAMVVSAVFQVDTVDRAELLERAIEQHYNGAVTADRTPCRGDDDRRGLCRPFGYLGSEREAGWLPLLLLNATSVDTGRQVIVSDLYIGALSPEPEDCRELFPHSYSVFEVLTTRPDGGFRVPADGCLTPGIANADDIRLSTAVVLSARFPFVSPKGNLRNADGMVVERVIDGSFFDNTGLESLMPVVQVLRDRGIRPIVIHVANKPWDAVRPGAYSVPGRPAGRQDPHHVRLATESGVTWLAALDDLASPLLALNSARSGHVERAEEAMMNLVSEIPGGLYVSPRLYPDPETGNDDAEICEDQPSLNFSLRNLSMSWWLSPLVRHIIDAQICDPRDNMLLSDVLTALMRPGAEG